MDDPDHSTERRIRAAMALADLDFDELAERIDTKGLGERTLRKLADPADSRGARPHELRLIAEACGVPDWFVAEGFARQGSPIEGRVAQLEAGTASLLKAVEIALDGLEDRFAAQIEQHVSEALKQARDSLGRGDQRGPT
jgi:hypothetical protein